MSYITLSSPRGLFESNVMIIIICTETRNCNQEAWVANLSGERPLSIQALPASVVRLIPLAIAASQRLLWVRVAANHGTFGRHTSMYKTTTLPYKLNCMIFRLLLHRPVKLPIVCAAAVPRL